MSTLALQRLVVRLAHDAAFVKLLAYAPEEALSGTGLDVMERRWLLSIDPRAFTADPDVAARTLRALLRAAKVPVALAAASWRTTPITLETFFSTDTFHQAVQAGRSLSVAFCSYLAGLGERGFVHDDRVNPLARLWSLRQAMAYEAREWPLLAKGEITLHPTVDVAWLPEGILELAAALDEALAGIAPEISVLAAAARQALSPRLDFAHMRPVLVHDVRSTTRLVQMSYLEPGLMHLLERLRQTRVRHEIGDGDVAGLITEGLVLSGET